MDRNSVTGLLLIGAILMGWMFWMAPSKEEQAAKKRQQDSIIALQKIEEEKKDAIKEPPVTSKIDTSVTITAVPLSDSAKSELIKQKYGVFARTLSGKEELITLENDVMKVFVSTRGGRIASVQLKNYKTYNGKPLLLFNADSSRQAVKFNSNNIEFSTDSMFFTPFSKGFTITGKDSKQLSMRLDAGTGKYLEFTYTLTGTEYMMGYSINAVGLQDIIESNKNFLTLDWNMSIPRQEKSHQNELIASTIYFKYSEDEVDYITETEEEKKSLEANTKWIAFKQQFFTSVLIADKAFEKPSDIETKNLSATGNYVKSFNAELTIPYNHQPKETFGMKMYFGPAHYQTLKQYDLLLEEQIPLGWGIFGWVNKFIVIPIFNFLNSFNLNFGIIILILTLIIKLLLFPIAYKTYLSSAKMKILKPEVDEMNKKIGSDDPLKKQQAMMALYKKAGVNPMAGCIPMLLQLPILIALFKFFPASIELRQEGFWWAEDLSTYDSIATLPFEIPFYGSHVSLWALLMTLSTILYTWSNSQLMGTSNQMPGMKVMMYLMPVMFLGILNSSASGLSYYYFLANMITFGQTYLMKAFVNEEALHRKIQENKKKPVKVSRFQQRLEEMAKQKQQMQQARKKR